MRIAVCRHNRRRDPPAVPLAAAGRKRGERSEQKYGDRSFCSVRKFHVLASEVYNGKTLGEPMPNCSCSCVALQAADCEPALVLMACWTVKHLIAVTPSGPIVRRAAAVEHHLHERVLRDSLRDPEKVRDEVLGIRIGRQIVARALRLEEERRLPLNGVYSR